MGVKGKLLEIASEDALDFVNRLLCIDPLERLTLSDAFKHPFLTRANPQPIYHPREVIKSLKGFTKGLTPI